MARILKRHTKGNVKNFITRTQAIRKLQISLQDFRKLCIFKGIYPREPRNKKRANKGSTAPVTFYYYKDIQYLQHEPLLNKFREHKTFMKKLTKYLNKGQVHQAHKLNDNKDAGFVGNWDLDHIVKERYPSFNEALRDLDDCLNMLFLFANLPTTDNKINNKVIKEANRLTQEWLTFVTEKRLIKKVFVSIKGVYYSCNIKGEEIRWTIPYKFPENMPTDIDFKIMLTFLEFYSTLLHFVLYKLYTDNGFIYPPKIYAYKLVTEEPKNVNIDKEELKAGKNVEGHDLNEELKEKALNADKKEEEEEENDEEDKENEDALDKFEDSNKNKGDLLQQPSKYDSPQATLFENFTFYIGREVSLDIIQFLILACGGKTICEADLDMSELKPDLSQVTHHICDRPVLRQRLANVVYIQPQWIFDSINKGELQAANLYLPGEKLPAHLSPWGDAIGYDPTANNGEEEDDEDEMDAEQIAEEDVDVEEEDEDLIAQKELEQEAKGVYKDTANADEAKKSKKKAKSAEEEEKDMKLVMMSNKQKKLYTKMQYSNKQKDDEIKKLKQRKQKLESKRK
ncbi:hypothetical protein HANVADRAFT_52057 [Hanseniaspora valbyensis NRRL Y-1626]|uniref:Pescadillo homolog n=1 Tax=Hanseniaspora valbyensis NRRL Y-1626 TaxID=766949 RepID=A0A1B7TFV1_9ASCO|nr:hypothetical protein HANVADRAFT_52057 [Hanseniaspora valbyensis NRRL Y-1626]